MLEAIFVLLALWFVGACLDSISRDLGKMNAWLQKNKPDTPPVPKRRQ